MSLVELLIARASRAGEPEPSSSPEAAPFDWGEVFSLLTDLRPAGFGEVLVTEGWPKPEEEDLEEGERPRAARLELKLLGLVHRYPLLRYDARHEAFFDHSRESRDQARHALIDPYTELACAFAGQDLSEISYHRSRVKSYAYASEARLGLGRAYVAIGRRKTALAVLEAATRADPHESTAWWYLGLARLFSRANRGAVQAFQTALDHRAGDADCTLGLGLALYHSKKYGEASELLRRQAGQGASGAWARSFVGCCYRMEERWEEARRELSALGLDSRPGWQEMARQCLACVDRGEVSQARRGPGRRKSTMWKELVAGVSFFSVIVYNFLEDYFRKRGGAIYLLPLLVLVFGAAGLLRRRLRRKVARTEELGSGIPGLPCWQLTTWMRPRRPEF